MEILQLRYFFDSAKTENFAKTAEKYMVPATSVSASVRRLEKELGCTLFDRTCNRIVLNDNGRRLQQSLCVIFEELEQAVESLSVINTDTREIKMLVCSWRGKITDNIIEYKEKHPNIVFKTVFDFEKTDFENYDIIIDEETDQYSEYEKFKLGSMRVRMKVSSNNPLCGRKLTLKQLCNQTFVSMGEQSNMHKILIRACKRAGFTPNIVVQTNDVLCYRKCIESGVGIGLSRGAINSDKIEYLDIKDFNEIQTVYCYYKRQADYGNIKNFLNFLRSKFI